MQSLTIKSENRLLLEIIKTYASQLESGVEILEDPFNDKDETEDYYYWKGVKIFKAKKTLDVDELSGSLPNLNLDPETYRQTLWERNKE